MPGSGGSDNCTPLGDGLRDQSPQQQQQDQQNHHEVAEHMKTPLKTVNQNRTTHRGRNRAPQLENQRPRSSSVSHIQWKKDSLVDQDLRAALSKRKTQVSSPVHQMRSLEHAIRSRSLMAHNWTASDLDELGG